MDQDTATRVKKKCIIMCSQYKYQARCYLEGHSQHSSDTDMVVECWCVFVCVCCTEQIMVTSWSTLLDLYGYVDLPCRCKVMTDSSSDATQLVIL